MRYRKTVTLALSLSAAIAASGQSAFAQRIINHAYQGRAPYSAVKVNARSSNAAYEEELPSAGPTPAPMPHGMHADPFTDDSFSAPGYGSGQGYAGQGACDSGYCCDSPQYCGSTCEPASGCSQGGQFFVHADYLYVRANFSDAVTFLETDNTQQGLNDREVNQFEFDYESSFRVGGGYRLCGCGDEVRFLYTRLASSAEDEEPFGVNIIVPYEIVGSVGGTYLFDADVDVNSYDLEYAKTIPLGGQMCCDCGDACNGGCGDCCAAPCPAWDITWSGGLRAADADWERTYIAIDANGAFEEGAVTTMDFEGVGAKIGLEGRRYFGCSGWFSIYMKGDISLLVGDLEFESVSTEDGGTAPDAVIRQVTDRRQIIPVTELEAGASGQVTCNSRVSAGYLLSAWHDLGFRDDFELDPVFPLEYDDANILGFDGFFARFEWAY